ncbi:MAG: hypothetical protein JJE03_01585 [Peptostreptococcaceae bacterium]|nr:hypothetical protein [Peptostreptococcaceae bacterium]
MNEAKLLKDIRKYLGSSTILDSISENKIGKILEEIKHDYTPRHIYGVYDVSIKKSTILFTGTILSINSQNLSTVLKDSEKCIILACTLGIEIEQKLKQFSKSNIEDGILYDAVSAAYIESYLDDVNLKLSKTYLDKGFYMTMRFSPGYGDVGLEVQPTILDILQAQKRIGLTTNDTHLLIPRKSITAFIGLQRTPYKNSEDRCAYCSIRNICELRKGGKYCGTTQNTK